MDPAGYSPPGKSIFPREPGPRLGKIRPRMSPNRIDRLFADLRAKKRKALVAYLVAGDPDLESTAQLVPALAEAGADLVELGVPFSDTLADGIVNQLGSQRALDSGTTLPKVLELVARLRREKCEIPLVLFTYYNPVFAYGREKFEKDAAKSGADGLLLLDLPPEEADRDLLKKITPLPVCVGFGISTPEQAREVARLADGVVVGSAIVDRIGKIGRNPKLSSEVILFLRPIAEAVHAA